jgi:hypothetical protein
MIAFVQMQVSGAAVLLGRDLAVTGQMFRISFILPL